MIRIENLVQNVISMKVTPFKRAKIAPTKLNEAKIGCDIMYIMYILHLMIILFDILL